MQSEEVKRGDELPTPPSRHLLQIMEGIVRIELLHPRDRLQGVFLHLAFPGDLVAVPERSESQFVHRASAITLVTFRSISPAHTEYQEAIARLPLQLIERHGHTMLLRSQRLVIRKIHALFDLMKRHANIAHGDFYRGDAIAQNQIASILGITPESVSRALKPYRQRSAI